MAVFVILGALFLALGALSGVLGVRLAWSRRRLLLVGCWTEGLVIGRDDDPDSHSITVEYADANGQVFQTRSRGAASTFPDVGATTRVLYDPSDPQRSELELDHQLTHWVLPVLAVTFGFVGVLMLLIGILTW